MYKKSLLSLVAMATLSFSSFGQTQEGFKYQASIRDAGNVILSNTTVGMRVTIQHGSIGGTTVYQEIFAPTTNATGVVNLKIGNGSVVSGNFNAIDWSAGPYFIETAVDVTGGTSYKVMGTSQLMSVPNVLHAETAVMDDVEPINDIQTISRAGTTVTLSKGGGTFQDSVGVYTAGSGIDITSNVIRTTSPCGLAIGQTYQGGIIFYLDASGCHGLISAPTDQSTGAQWVNGTSMETRAYGSGLFEGKYNTVMIHWKQGGATSAAAICYILPLAGYTDWYLPSIHELKLMYQNIGQGNTLGLGNVGDFGSVNYWSSTEYDEGVAWYQDFEFGGQANYDKVSPCRVRAVRAF